MNYLQELRAFKDWCLINQPPCGQIALWHALMMVANASGWQEWVTVPGRTLELLSGLSHSGINNARKGLIDRGRLEYRPSDNRKKASKYKIIPFCQILTQKKNEWENESRNELENEWENESASQQRTSEGTLSKQNKTKINKINLPMSLFEDYTQNAELLQRLKDFVEMRNALKKPMTDRAKRELLIKLDKLASNEEEKIAILDQSIFHSWQGVFPLKQQEGRAGPYNAPRSNSKLRTVDSMGRPI